MLPQMHPNIDLALSPCFSCLVTWERVTTRVLVVICFPGNPMKKLGPLLATKIPLFEDNVQGVPEKNTLINFLD